MPEPKEGTMAEKTEGQPVFEIADGKPLERTMFLNAIAYGLETGYFREDSQRVNDYAGRSATFLRALAHQHQEGTGVGEDWPARVRMMAEKLDAAADTWQDRDDLPDHCRRLANRARQIVNAIPATSPTEQGGEISPDIPAPNWFPPTWKGEMP